MNNEDKKLKNFLDKHDLELRHGAHPNEWLQISQKIEQQKSWWTKRLILVAASAAVVFGAVLTFNVQKPLQQQVVMSDEEAVTYLIEAYSIVDNGFETTVDDYYTLLN